MKKLLILILITVSGLSYSFAQSVPAGMKYQAVARNSAGEVLPNRTITLRIQLKGAPIGGSVSYYTEEHEVITNKLGLFDLVVGEGKNKSGVFSQVPWSTENIWMAVSLKEKGSDFTAVSESKLLAVPYAFHALTAGSLVSGSNNESSVNQPGVPSNNWSLQGNYGSDPLKDKLGNTDYVDLVMVTNNIERLRIKANGDIDIKRSLKIGANLTVDSSAYLNKIGGQTFNYGPFTVDRKSPTLLSGTLTVDLATDLNLSLNVDGPTDLNSRLFVNNASPTKLTGTLRVDSATDLNSSLSVNNGSPTLLTGKLRVNKPALFKDSVFIDDLNHESLSPSNGALVVAGGLGIGRNLNVGGASKFGGPVAFAAAVTISDLTQSINTGTGALMVAGGVGIGKRLNVGEAAQVGGTLSVAGVTSITNTTGSTATSNGALVVSGGAGIAQNAYIGGSLTTGSTATINNKLTVNANGDYAAEFNNPGANGLAIKIGTAQPNGNNNFVTFLDHSGNTVGRIEGQTLDELHNDVDYLYERRGLVYDVASGALDAGLATYNLGDRIAFQIEADASANVCAGVGVVACPPIASFVAGSIAEVALAVIEEALVIAEVAVASTNLVQWTNNKEGSFGVTYQSGAGDYAEFLKKANSSENLHAGDIVGVKGGLISKQIEGAEKVMVVSQNPIVLGNTPAPGDENSYEKIAFMGQVPVRVFGKVNLGDYIIPNGVNNGVGIAVSPEKLSAKDAHNIVGIAWSVSKNDMAINVINVAIGLNINNNAAIIEKQQNEIDALKNQIASTNAQLERLIPGFKAAGSNSADAYVAKGNNTAQLLPGIKIPSNNQPVRMAAYEVQYMNVTRADFEKGFDIAQEKLISSGNIDKYKNFWSKYNSDPVYKKLILDKLMKKYSEELAAHKALDAQLNR